MRGAGKEGQLVQYIEHNHLQFVAHEFGPFLPLTAASSHIVYVTVVRNPWDRVLSAAHHGEDKQTDRRIDRERDREAFPRSEGVKWEVIYHLLSSVFNMYLLKQKYDAVWWQFLM